MEVHRTVRWIRRKWQSPTKVHRSPSEKQWECKVLARSDTCRLLEHAPQNRLRNGCVLVQVCRLPFSTFCHYAQQLPSILLWSVSHERGFVWIPEGSLNTLHKKPFTKWLCSCPGMSSSTFDFLPLCSTTSQYLTVVRFA
jgi:hypothetical protein